MLESRAWVAKDGNVCEVSEEVQVWFLKQLVEW